MVHQTPRRSICALGGGLLIVDVVAKHISLNLAEKSAQHMLDLKALACDCDLETTLHSNIIVLKQTNQLKAMTTIIRDKESDREEFIFYLERTSSLVLERYYALAAVGLITVHWMNCPIRQRRW